MTNNIIELGQDLIKKNPGASKYINDISLSVAERAFYNTFSSYKKIAVKVRFEYAENLLTDKSEVNDAIIEASNRGAEVIASIT